MDAFKRQTNSVEKNVNILVNGEDLEMYMWYKSASCASLSLAMGSSKVAITYNIHIYKHFTVCRYFQIYNFILHSQ